MLSSSGTTSKAFGSQSTRRPPPVDPNMTPMIDVVFLLIIFFLVSSHLAQRENRLELPLPQATTSASNLSDEMQRITINIEASGQTLLGMKPIDQTELLSELNEQQAKYGDQLRVRLRGDRTVTYQHIEPLLAACAEVGISDIGLAVHARQEKRD